MAGIRGSGAKFAGSVFLQDGFVAEDAVLLDWAYISGSLNCTNGKFTNPQGAALSCRGATIAGGVLLQAVVSEGTVLLPQADIRGNLNCKNGKFTNLKDAALSCRGAKIAGHVYLDGFVSEGEVSLHRAGIGGNLKCTNGKFTNRQGLALSSVLASPITTKSVASANRPHVA